MFQVPVMSTVRHWWRTRSTRQRRLSIGAVTLPVLITLGAFALQPPEIADLSEENRHRLPNLLSQWENGDVIVLLRHLERCDKEDYPCWEGNEGITARSVAIGHALADSYVQLGLDKTEIYNSPLARTAQTEAIVFDDVGVDQNWLYECRNTMLRDAIAHKTQGKNLVLVTHSSCIDAFEKALGYDSDKPQYGTSLFFSSTGKPDSLDVLGFLDADDFSLALGLSPSTPTVASRAGRARLKNSGVM
jgi:hypothetical protein